ncbi:MAG: glycosyltransferase [Candidatus Xenobia bacterium]
MPADSDCRRTRRGRERSAPGPPGEAAWRTSCLLDGIQESKRFYVLADALVVPSRFEPWGLVINEAMVCGLPVLATDVVGAVPDLVTDGVT